MSANPKPRQGVNYALFGGGVLMVVCCAVGPAVIGAVAGSAIGGWLGIACAVILAVVVGLILHRRTRSRGSC
jgi:Mn2+/Fe2+ NRAMP family transporter